MSANFLDISQSLSISPWVFWVPLRRGRKLNIKYKWLRLTRPMPRFSHPRTIPIEFVRDKARAAFARDLTFRFFGGKRTAYPPVRPNNHSGSTGSCRTIRGNSSIKALLRRCVPLRLLRIILSHFGRPKKGGTYDPSGFSLSPWFFEPLCRERLGRPCFLRAVIASGGDATASSTIDESRAGLVALSRKTVRFHPEEEQERIPGFARNYN